MNFGMTCVAHTRSLSTDWQGKIEKAIRDTFRPEFLNRIDDIIIFSTLALPDVERIVDLQMKGVSEPVRVFELRGHGELKTRLDVSHVRGLSHFVGRDADMGDVVGDLNRRRGLIQGMDDGPAGKMVHAEVPLKEMFGYATDLRSASQGRATFSMEFLKYMEAPSSIADEVIKKSA